MITRRSLLFGLLFLDLVTRAASGQTTAGPGKALFNGYSGSPKLKLARFHSLWVCAVETQPSQQTRSQLEYVFARFQQDLFDAQSQLGEAPIRELMPVPRPTRELDLVTRQSTDSRNPGNIRRADEPTRSDGQVHKDDVVRALDQLKEAVEEDDVLFVYVMAHGRLDDRARTILRFAGNEDLDREVIVDHVRRLTRVAGGKARLAVLITDNCNVRGGGSLPEIAPGPSIWRSLYFGLEGFVDIQSTTPKDRQGKPTSQIGVISGDVSLFVRAFQRALSLYSVPAAAELERQGRHAAAQDAFRDALDKNPKDGVVDWTEFADHLQAQFDAEFAIAIRSLGVDSAIGQQMNKNPQRPEIHNESHPRARE